MIGDSSSPLCRVGCLTLGPSPSFTADMDGATPSDTMPRRDNERDMELDKRIEALRRKNEALMKRYQEVEEDRKRAEEEGMALQSRKGKADDLTITISKSTSDTRVVVTKPSVGGSPAKSQQEPGSDKMGKDSQMGFGHGRRKQLMVTMAGKKGKRVVSERAEKKPVPSEEGQGQRVEPAERVKEPSHNTKRDAPQDEVRQVQRQTEKRQKHPDPCQESEGHSANTDLTIPTSKEEQEEYLRWKREREQIDRERVARHKNAKGQWRREWDVDKTDNMFADKLPLDKDRATSSKVGRNTRRGHTRSNASSQGHDMRGKEKGAQNVPVVSSKAQGKDRLTGRARRWDANEEGEHLENSETTLEEFLEELDAFTDPETEGEREGEPKSSPSLNVPDTEDGFRASGSAGEAETGGQPGSPGPTAAHRTDTPTQKKAETYSPRGLEKKVRFSPEPEPVARAGLSTGSEPRGLNSATASSPSRIGEQASLSGEQASSSGEQASLSGEQASLSGEQASLSGEQASSSGEQASSSGEQASSSGEQASSSGEQASLSGEQASLSGEQPLQSAQEDVGSPQVQGERPAPVARRQASENPPVAETECDRKGSVAPGGPGAHPAEKACASLQECSVKCNLGNRNPEELIDSSLSVLGSGATAHTTSTDKARQNGKIV